MVQQFFTGFSEFPENMLTSIVIMTERNIKLPKIVSDIVALTLLVFLCNSYFRLDLKESMDVLDMYVRLV